MHQIIRRSALLVTAGIALTAADTPHERVVRMGETVPISVNGQVRRVRLEPAAPGLLLLTQDYADAASLKTGGLFQIMPIYAVGDARVVAKTAVARFAWREGKPSKRRVGWAPLPYADGIDAVMGPAGLDDPVVRFQLHAPRPGERTVAMPMGSVSGWFGSWYGLRAEVTVGGAPLMVRFDPLRARTVANALAGQRLARAFGGRFDGSAVPQEIAFGIERPVRPMALARPVDIGPLKLSRIWVRTVPDLLSGGSTAGIKEAGDPDEIADPADVVVMAKKGKKPRAGTLTLGADQLDRCSALVFDKPEKEIRLTCL